MSLKSAPNNDGSLPPSSDLPTPRDPASKGKRRQFGTVLRQRSGRYQAVYKVEGERFIAPVTFFTKGDANS